ncbi:aminotransferase [Salinibacterium xinjiangense]|uniref:dTDP-4-amino-4,6-dideoxygalactose transaminase n=1 Tax=Salinibacterium xinjiangense TaxID=386302 RepID=A0A2C8Y9T9_9MICO|nr:DegT/DnrJ/EryC1/StrS family aminotransferase [Salinibacterium xinjiangense]GGK96022.1 aminotransferase [Salinibacterium xinjiangense]SOE46922.1 dTDP-4-amino-4,6-dideoxygalactose transaminase [Salinibacterium xinjiangense]
MPIPFSLPLIDDDVIAEVNDALTGTGWLTTGPKVRQLEAEISAITGTPVLCVNSWTSGAMLMLHWFGVGPGDEVIIPAYTYSATALCAMNLGATVVMVDVDDDFTISAANIRAAITPRTKAVIPVDMAGWPADYDAIKAVLAESAVVAQFTASTERQARLGRILLISDAAHSIGSTYKGQPNGRQADAAIFSLHSVKNITTGEGGAICINLPAPFDNDAEYLFLRAFALNGQTKSAFEKNQPGAWRYDIIDQGMKVNMPDIGAAIGLAQIRKYQSTLLPDRKRIFARYQDGFAGRDWAILPVSKNGERESSCHLYMLRIAGVDETARDAIIQAIADHGVGVNVHYIPMAMLTLFRNRGFDIADYPKTYGLYSNEITLPLYNGLTDEQVDEVIRVVIESVESML